MKAIYWMTIGLFFTSVAVVAGVPASSTGQFSADIGYLSGKFVVMLEPGTPQLQIDRQQNRAPVTGVRSIDELCRRCGVINVSPFYPGKLTKPALVRVASRLYIFSLDNGRKANEIAPLFAADPNIRSAEMIAPAHLCYTPNDPFISLQWQFNRTQTLAAWDVVRGDTTKHSVIAIIDTGINYDHEDMAANIWVNPGEDINDNGIYDPEDINGLDDDDNGFIDDIIGWNFTDQDNDPMEDFVHGSGVASCASEVTDNGILGAGIGFSAKLMALKAVSSIDQIEDGYIAMLYAAENGANIINCSWGISVFAEYQQAIIDAVWDEDVLIVASAGSSGEIIYPAAYNHVMAVAATDENDHAAYFSTIGEWIDICAPGVNLYMLWGDEFSVLSGTSFSSAFVSGVAALVRAWYPDLTNAQVEQLLKEAADNIDDLNPGHEGELGAGRINAAACFTTDIPASQASPRQFGLFTNYPNPFNASTEIRFDLSEGTELTIEIFNILGEKTAMLADGFYPAGAHSLIWDATAQPTGVYFYKIRTARASFVKKCLLLK